MSTTLLKLSCPDRVGLLSRLSGFVAEHGGNLVEVHQFTDPLAGWFFTRMAIETATLRCGLAELRASFAPRFRGMMARPICRQLRLREEAQSSSPAMPVRENG